ncbi:hypothetical protein [Salinicoccus roseus]|uniref:hypothetical protein n=1 Tax=Salinicoccus roseus TaxID=45670 RepID=UPI00223AD512|nr:hypothetical protein [Salinicoccus roseus]
MELRKYLMAGGFASVLVLGACGGDSAEEDTMEEEPLLKKQQWKKKRWKKPRWKMKSRQNRIQSSRSGIKRLRNIPEPLLYLVHLNR